MIDKEGEIEIGDIEDGIEYVNTDDSGTSGDDSGVQQTVQNTQSELSDLLSDGDETIDTDTVEYSSDEYYESIESRQAEGEALQEEFLNGDDDIIETEDTDTESDDYDDDE
jgi:hypothetical protein